MNSKQHIVVGANWGDEGKGRMVDYFAQQADIVVRYQGGNNAGHTVINEFGEFKLHLLPSGVFNPDTLNVLGPGMVIDLAGLKQELDSLAVRGIKPKLMISDRATVVLPLHRLEDEWEEARLGSKAYGSTRNGIAYAYADRAAKKALQIGQLLDQQTLHASLKRWYDWKTPMLKGLYGSVDIPAFEDLFNSMLDLSDLIKPMVGCTTELFQQRPNARVLMEAQLGSLRDISFGNYPYTTSSHVLSHYAALGSGLLALKAPRITAVVKAFSSSVGAGPFPCAMQEQDDFREKTGEFGARTGRPRDVGHFDAVATKYGVALQQATDITLTKLDCLSGKETLEICIGYKLNGVKLQRYPLSHELFAVQPMYKTMPGWQEDISDIRIFEELPLNAQNYVIEVERLTECAIKYVSVGPERSALICR